MTGASGLFATALVFMIFQLLNKPLEMFEKTALRDS